MPRKTICWMQKTKWGVSIFYSLTFEIFQFQIRTFPDSIMIFRNCMSERIFILSKRKHRAHLQIWLNRGISQ